EDIVVLHPRDIVNHVCSEVGAEAAEHCIYVFTFDACHSKSNYKSVYLSASVVDSEGKLVPIAFAICSVENSNNWMWFCEHLYIALPRMNSDKTVIISDYKK
ncbi:10415_t:CDS:2, partial [Scutellospora calospora]